MSVCRSNSFSTIRQRLIGTLLVVSSLLLINVVTFAQARRVGRPLPPPQYIPPHNYDQRNIKLNLRFDWEQEQAIATATITVVPVVRDLRRVEFDAAYMTISGVTLTSGAPLRFDYDGTREKLGVELDRPYQLNEEITVVVSYRTNQPTAERLAQTGGGGLTFIKPRPDEPNRPRQIWSQGESESNHFWFPCFDHPNDFVTTQIVATVERPLAVISNGALISTTENADGTRTFDWKMEDPHATYLTSIVVGEYATIAADYAGVPVMTNVYVNEVEEGKVTAARLPEMVKFFSEKLGIKYPYPKYAQTMARDFSGGMENISATTQTDNMIHDARSELDANTDSLQAHELVHSWFGNYVTARTWSELWLNESFATYLQAIWDESKLGRDDFLYADVRGNQESYYSTWNRGQRRPVVTRNYSDPDAVFDAYAYQRGAAVLHMLRTYLGDDNWWRSLKYYLSRHAHQPVETAQLRIAIEETTGQPMEWFFDQWVYKMGHPVFRVTQDYDAAKKILTLKVRQEQRPDPESQYPQAGFFQTPVDIEIGTATTTRVDRVQIEAREEQTLRFAVDSEPLLVRFDYGDTLIKELMFVKTNGQLLYQAEKDPDVLGRIWALSQLSARMHDDKTTSSDRDAIVKALSAAATKDKFWGTRVQALTALSGIREAKDALLAATQDQDARVRVRAVTSLAATKDPTLADTYVQLTNDRSYAVIRAAALALGQTQNGGAYDSLVKLIDLPSWRDTIRASGMSGLAALGDARALELGFKYRSAPNPIAVRLAAVNIIGATGKNDPRTFDALNDTLRQGFERRITALINSSGEALVALGDQRGIATFQELARRASGSPQLASTLTAYEARLRAKLATSKPGD